MLLPFIILVLANGNGERVAMLIHVGNVYTAVIQFLWNYVKEELYMIKKISNLVHELLKSEPDCRNSDNILYLRVLQTLGSRNGIDVNNMSVPTLMLRMREYGLPPIESVGRARRKIQECNPELRANDTVEAYREVLEEEYVDYARRYTV